MSVTAWLAAIGSLLACAGAIAWRLWLERWTGEQDD